jgi:hypothetical protein
VGVVALGARGGGGGGGGSGGSGAGGAGADASSGTCTSSNQAVIHGMSYKTPLPLQEPPLTRLPHTFTCSTVYD